MVGWFDKGSLRSWVLCAGWKELSLVCLGSARLAACLQSYLLVIVRQSAEHQQARGGSSRRTRAEGAGEAENDKAGKRRKKETG